jgi:hypothetical protein
MANVVIGEPAFGSKTVGVLRKNIVGALCDLQRSSVDVS